MSRRKPKQKPTGNPVPPVSRRKLFYFRLLALVDVPLLLLGVLEVGSGWPVLDIQQPSS